ncbi:hypothetical protein [Sphingopyxis sp.]|uniref:hypothetical protein n=1 Tax=Sphingopyxis sp. TaxID=1908224 RepID=UPI003D11FA65
MALQPDPPNLNVLRDDLLVALAAQGSSNTKPLSPIAVLREARSDVNWDENPQLARDAGWLLIRNEPSFARSIRDSDKPAMMLLALTAAGKARASEISEARKPLTWKQRLSKIPVGKGIWETTKLLLAAAAGAAAKSYFG